DRRARRLPAGPPELPRQTADHAAVPAADHHPADHLWHPAGHGDVQRGIGPDPGRGRPGEPGALGTVRHHDDDPVHRADQPHDRERGTDVRCPDEGRLPACPRSAPGARHPCGRHPRAGAHRGMFELTFLVSGPPTDTLVVAIYRAMTAAGGGEARSLISAMAVVYTVTMLIILIVALRFVNPTQLVARVPETRDD